MSHVALGEKSLPTPALVSGFIKFSASELAWGHNGLSFDELFHSLACKL